MSKKYQFRIIQFILVMAIIVVTAFIDSDDTSISTKCLLEVVFVLFITLDIPMKHIKQWQENKCIENKKELIKDILSILLFCLLMVGIVIAINFIKA